MRAFWGSGGELELELAVIIARSDSVDSRRMNTALGLLQVCDKLPARHGGEQPGSLAVPRAMLR
jgi:hypothetical protein